MKLSILICTLPQREDDFNRLLESLEKQLPPLKKYYENMCKTTVIQIWDFGEVEILAGLDNKEITVGAKRNKLMDFAHGQYISYIDDDDRITSDYVYYLLKGIETNCDVVNFQVMYNPKNGKEKIVLYSLNYNDSESPHCYYRTTNHLMGIKRDLALQVKFKSISFAEDADFAKRLKGVAKTQADIKKVLYYYDFDHAKSETQ